MLKGKKITCFSSKGPLIFKRLTTLECFGDNLSEIHFNWRFYFNSFYNYLSYFYSKSLDILYIFFIYDKIA